MVWRSAARVRVRELPGVFLVRLTGDFDVDEVDLLLAAWDEADERALPATVVDLTGCTFGDSSFLHALLLTRARHRRAVRRLVLAGPLQPQILLLLAVSGTVEVFDIADSVHEAVARPDEGQASRT
ncbi:STAS domain-containing protein [Streptomyces sp. NPDC049916]|uniref:STAS domain-containing protein n=1 Tax=Streptomyces sp. NPDC049916 TaxID=3155156 RepID=UPI00341945EA